MLSVSKWWYHSFGDKNLFTQFEFAVYSLLLLEAKQVVRTCMYWSWNTGANCFASHLISTWMLIYMKIYSCKMYHYSAPVFHDLNLHVLKTCFAANASREYATNSNCINKIFVAKRMIEWYHHLLIESKHHELEY